MDIASMEKTCRAVRRDIINMTADAASGHPGGSLSAVEIITTLFFGKMNIDPANPKKADRDRFVLSKGHAAPCYYAVLGRRAFLTRRSLKTLGSFTVSFRATRMLRNVLVWRHPPDLWDRGFPLLSAWLWVLRNWITAALRSIRCWETGNFRRGRCGRLPWQLHIISWTI